MSWNDEFDQEHDTGVSFFDSPNEQDSAVDTNNELPESNVNKEEDKILEHKQPSVSYQAVYQPQGNAQGGQYSYYNPQQKKKNTGLAVASFVVSLVSIFTSCCFGGVLGILSLILGCISLARKEDGKPYAILGIAISVISMVITILIIVFGVLVAGDFVSEIENGTGEDVFAGQSFVGEDKSELSFDTAGGYVYYVNQKDHEDGSYSGSYTYYNGKEAALYLAEQIFYDLDVEYDKDLLKDAFSGVKNGKEEEFYCLVLDVDKKVMDQETQSGDEEIIYFGYHRAPLLDVINTGNYKEVLYYNDSSVMEEKESFEEMAFGY